MSKTLAEILNDCQRTFASHKKGLAALRKVQLKNPDKFAEEFINCLNRLLTVFKREPAVERLIQFVVHFATYAENDTHPNEEFAVFLIGYLLEYTNAAEKAVRFRSSQLIANIINSLNDDAELDEGLCEDLLQKMLARVRDRLPIVRCQAVHALSRLQNPADEEDPVIQEYIRLMSDDTSAYELCSVASKIAFSDVRKAVLTNIGLSKHTLHPILDRTKDTKEDVRRHAYDILAKKVTYKVLSISQRISLLKEGLKDRNDQVREACINMICSGWIGEDGDIVKLLKAADVEEYEETVELILKHVFPRIPVTAKFDIETLDSEQAIMWRMYFSYLKEHKKDDQSEEMLPEISKICKYIVQYQENEFVVKQLLLMTQVMDFSDEVGRRNLSNLLRGVIAKNTLSEGILKVMLQVLRSVHKEEEFIRLMVETIADIQDPLEAFEKEENKEALIEAEELLNNLYQEISELKRKKASLVKAEKFAQAQQIKEEMESLEAKAKQLEEEHQAKSTVEDQAWLKCLLIAQDLLENCVESLEDDPGIIGILNTIVLPSIKNDQPILRTFGMKCLGLVCLLSPEEAQKHLQLFIQAAENDKDDVQFTSLTLLLDITLLYGKYWRELEQRQQTSDTISVDQLMEKFTSFLAGEDIELKTAAVEGIAKLYLHNVHSDPRLMAQLIVMYFNPEDEDNPYLRQCLSVFFPTFAFSSISHQAIIKEAFLPACRGIMYAPPKSPLKKVPIATVGQLLVHLTDSANLQKKKDENEDAEVVPRPHNVLSLVSLPHQ